MLIPDWRAQLAAADARQARARAEMSAGADDRARALAAGVDYHQELLGGGRGTRRTAVAQVAAELNLSVKSVDTALAKVNAGLPARSGLPGDLWEQVAAAELSDLPPLTRAQWEVLGHLVRGIALDAAWIDAPGELLAQEIEDVDTDVLPDSAVLAQACRSWSRTAALAVLEALTRGEQAALPTVEQAPLAADR
ncbi:hypothetical protein ABT352_33375 [Streptosporangium sp. NPDC000563]|uniref:hypothetical protein n=1 Tax=Streptosporangium sp. NPDC000563 TaxID=3154366 RepID=UPI003318BAC0